MTHELQRRFRPKSFRQVVGQVQPLKILQAKLDTDGVPHALLLTGPSGTGKTTVGRILKDKLNAGPNFIEFDAARNNGIDAIRQIEHKARLNPMSGDSTVYLIDEAHQLTTPAQQAFLKILEEPPAHVYFFLATTHPEKLISTIRNRCTHVALKAVGRQDLEKLLRRVSQRIEFDLEDEVLDAICKEADGSPRKALVLLDVVRVYDNIEEQLGAVKDSDTERESKEICQILFRQGGERNWLEMTKVLKSVKEEPEKLRRMVLAYARSILLANESGSPKQKARQQGMARRAAVVIEAFHDNYFDSGASGLALSCWQVIHGE